MKQYYKIAGLTVEMDSFGRTAEQALPYVIAESTKADIKIESDLRNYKATYPDTPEEVLEYVATGRDFYTKLIDHSGIMLHASAVAMDGKAYLFSADSGIGKSTHAWLWRQVFGDERVTVINDDKPALRLQDGAWYAYGTPWSGKTGLNKNMGCPLAGICLLERNQTNSIAPYVQSDIVFRIMKQTYRPKDALRSEKILTLIGSLLEKVPVWRLKCNMEPEAAYTAWEAMTGNVSELRPKE